MARNANSAPGRFEGWFVALFFFAFVALSWVATRTPGALLDLFENGHWLGPASDMLAGKFPYRDTFPMHGFLSDGGRDYLVFRMFGPSLKASVETRHFIESFFHPALFLVAAAASRRPLLAALAVPLNIGMSIAVVADRPVLPLLSLAAFAWALGEERSRARAFAAGGLAGLGLLYSLDFGTFVLGAEVATIAACLGTSRRRPEPCPFRPRSWLLGLAAVLFPWFAFLGMHGALWQFVKVSFIDLPTRFESLWGLHFPAPWELIREWLRGHPYMAGNIPVGPSIAKRFYLAPLFGGTGAVVAILAMRRRETPPAPALRLLALSLASLAFFRYVLFRFHLSTGNALAGPIFFLLLVLAFEALRPRFAAPRLLAAVVFAGALAALAMNGPGRLLAVLKDASNYRARTAPVAWMVPLTVPRGGGIRVPRDEEKNLRSLIEFTDRHSAPNDPILDLSNRAGLYFFLRRVNPTRFAEVPPMAPFQDEILRQLRARPPALVFLETGTWLDAIDGILNSTRIPRVWAWVLENYPVREKVGDTIVALPAGTPSRP